MSAEQPSSSVVDAEIREAEVGDFEAVAELMTSALEPYYGGDHRRHAERIFNTHISGGQDRLGFFSTEQKMYVATVDGEFSAMIHIVGKRQRTYKISPLIVSSKFRVTGIGQKLLDHAVRYAISKNARQIYCTVALDNRQARACDAGEGLFFGVRTGRSRSRNGLGTTPWWMLCQT